ncbi:UNVERIFIED_CONTAM: F-box protein [Sesamum calycinum]|uniref:F-box protein n=1 Tax=Sesamum calycinum TaxID=2727403 RepID=A0AAW2Q394_9LAMI
MESRNQSQIKKTKYHNDKDEGDPSTANSFAQLPHEIVIDILSRLPITSLIRLSFACRSFNTLSQDPNLVNLHLSRLSMNESSCLIFHSDYPIRNQLHVVQLSDERLRRIDPPFANSMPEFSILGSCNGLLCLINTLFRESISLYNPFTRAYLELPKNYDLQDQVIVYGFGFHPVTNDYKVIKIAYHTVSFYRRMARNFRGFKTHQTRQESEVRVYSLSRNAWENKGTMPYRLEKWSSPGILVSGRLHWVSLWGKFNGCLSRAIVAYDLADDSFHVIMNPGSVRGPFGRWAGCNLAALDGRLCAAVPVPPGHGALDIWILKDYGVSESWVKEYSVGVYYPVSMINPEQERSLGVWRNMVGKKSVRLCVLRSGEVVLEYRGGGLVAYDPESGSLRELVFDGMPRIYQTTHHVGSLQSAASPL